MAFGGSGFAVCGFFRVLSKLTVNVFRGLSLELTKVLGLKI